MFLVFNKQKIYSYLVALSTVVVLFFVASLYNNKSEQIIQTVANLKSENSVIQNKVKSNEYNSNNINNKNIICEIKEYILSKINNNK